MDAFVHLPPVAPALMHAEASFLEVTFVGDPQLPCSPSSPPLPLTLGGLGLQPEEAWAVWASQPVGPHTTLGQHQFNGNEQSPCPWAQECHLTGTLSAEQRWPTERGKPLGLH